MPAAFWLVAVMLLLELPAAFLLNDPLAPEMRYYRALHLVEMVLLVIIVVAGFGLRSRVAAFVVAGLALSFCGDLVNSFLIDLSGILKPQTLLSIPPFVAAHLCYVAAFVMLLRSPPGGGPAPGRGMWLTALAAWPVLAVGLWWLLIDRSAPPLLLNLSLGYAFIVTLMGVMAVLLGLRLQRTALWPALGGLMFVVSDSIFGAWLLEGAARPVWVSQAIWITYFLAQAGISRAPALVDSKSPG